MSGFSRRWFLHASGLAFLALAVRRLAALGAPRPRDDVPWKVQQVLKQLFGDRPVQDGHVQLDVPTVAADGRVVPVMIESDLPMAAERYVKAVHLLVEHPMATGLFRDARGNPIPAYFINDVSVTYGDREAAHFVWSSGISRDPFVEFSLRADREAALKFVWKDNKGGVFQQSVDIRFI